MLSTLRLIPAHGAQRGLVIAIHGSDRDRDGLAAGFAPLAAEGVALALPLFAEGDDYKFLAAPQIAASGGAERGPERGPEGRPAAPPLCPDGAARVIDAVIAAEAGDGPVWLFGFSGGAQLAQRYALTGASRLAGVILAAPGSVTLPRDDLDWWPGLAGMAAATGRTPDLAALRRVPVVVQIGAGDRADGFVPRRPGMPYGHAQADIAGADRRDLAETLTTALAAAGVAARLTVLPGVGHALAPHADAAVTCLRGWAGVVPDPLTPITHRETSA